MVVPYFGPGVLEVDSGGTPAGEAALAEFLAKETAVPRKLGGNLHAIAQYIESFKHRKTLARLMHRAFGRDPAPGRLHRYFARQRNCPMIVDAWYDRELRAAFAGRSGWGEIRGLSRHDHPGSWYRCVGAQGEDAGENEARAWDTLIYKPLGAAASGASFVVSDSDFVEILTEIDIQTPIPSVVQERRIGRHFLFLGCRFNSQIGRIMARQIAKRSSDFHWAVLADEPTRKEARFLEELHIRRIEMPLSEMANLLAAAE